MKNKRINKTFVYLNKQTNIINPLINRNYEPQDKTRIKKLYY